MKTALSSVKFWVALGASVVFGLGVSVRAAGVPELMIVAPLPATTIAGTSVEVTLSPTNFDLVDYQTNAKALAGQGHIHLWLDQVSQDRASAVKLVSDTYTFTDVKPGNHTLVAELVANDHSSLQPPVQAAVIFATIPAVEPMPQTSHALLFAILAFILLTAALYFVNLRIKATPRSQPRSRKSSSKSASRRRSK